MIMTPQAIEALAKRFFDAIELGDIASMRDSFVDDAAIWHNTDEEIVSPDQTVQTLTGMVQRITDIRYSERQLSIFPGGFVQQHVLTGTRRHDGVAVRLPCAIICQLEEGRIKRLDEYFDSAHVATFRKYANS